MIRVRHIFVSHPPHEKGQVTIWPSLCSAKNVKKAARGVRFKSGLVKRGMKLVIHPQTSAIASVAHGCDYILFILGFKLISVSKGTPESCRDTRRDTIVSRRDTIISLYFSGAPLVIIVSRNHEQWCYSRFDLLIWHQLWLHMHFALSDSSINVIALHYWNEFGAFSFIL